MHQTTLSLHQAAAQITDRASATDGRLFLLKHLLALKSQIVAFDFEYVTPQMSNVSNVTSTFWELRERGGLFDLGNLWRLVGGGLLPRIVENMLDAKVELDGRLRTVINDLTNSFATRALGPLAEPGLENRGFNAAAAVQAARGAAEKVAPELRQKLEGYLTDVRIRETLVEAVFEQMMQKYERFYEAYKKTRQMNGKAISGKGKGREDDVWDPESFSEWAEKVFDIGEGRLHGVNGDDQDEEDSSGVSRAGSV